MGPRLLLITNRKLHTRFRVVPESMTLDDLERPIRTLFQSTSHFGAHHENFNEERLRHRAVSLRQYGFLVFKFFDSYTQQEICNTKQAFKIPLHSKSVAPLPSENYHACSGTVLLKYELARDLMFGRQQLLWQKQITVVLVGFTDFWVPDRRISNRCCLISIHLLIPPVTDWASLLCEEGFMRRRLCFFLLQQKRIISQSVIFSV